MRSAFVVKQNGVSDFLRFNKGVAILLIAFHHFARSLWLAHGVPTPNLMQWYFLPSGENSHQTMLDLSNGQYSRAILSLFAQFGYVGVHIFVLMSGVGLALGTSSAAKAGAFLQRRFDKLIPPFWTAVVFFAAFREIIDQPYTVREVLERICLLTTFDQQQFFRVDPPLWCLAIFFQLYLIFLPLRWLIARFGPRIILAFAGIAFLSRSITCLPVISNWNIFFGHAMALDWLAVFGIGIWAGDKLRNEGKVEIPTPVFGGSMLLASVLLILSETFRHVYPIHDSAIGVLAGGTMLLMFRAVASTFFCRWLAAVGSISFPLYLYHRPIVGAVVFLLRKDLGSGVLEPLSIGVLSVASLVFIFLLIQRLAVGKPKLMALALGSEPWAPRPAVAHTEPAWSVVETNSIPAAGKPVARD